MPRSKSAEFCAQTITAQGGDGKPDLAGPPEPFVYPDIHSLEVHPSSPDLVYAPTGGGFYRSDDGGKTWKLLYDCYCRAIWVDPHDPEHLVLSPADAVDRNGRIEESHDGAKTWSLASSESTLSCRETLRRSFASQENACGMLCRFAKDIDQEVPGIPIYCWARD